MGSTNERWKDLPEKVRNAILFGSDGDEIAMRYDDGLRTYTTKRPFEGVIPNMERRWKDTDSAWLKEELGRYQNTTECEVFHGKRLKPELLAVKIRKLSISEVADLSILQAADWFGSLDQHLSAKHLEIAARILKEINERLGFLKNVGLEYLTLSRTSGTLSGGESQRIRLASQIGSGLTRVLYVLDEPSIGLHQRDNARPLETPKRPRHLRHTLIVGGHDEDPNRPPQYVVGVGAGAAMHDRIEGLENIDKIIDIDQSPIGRTPRSNPATYTGAFTPIREWFAGLPEAKARGYEPGRFSFNVKGGRCEACQGDGVIKIEMHFLPDVYVTCDTCKGKRYNRETLEVLFMGKSIADLLDMTVEEPADFFRALPRVRQTITPSHPTLLVSSHVTQTHTTPSPYQSH